MKDYGDVAVISSFPNAVMTYGESEMADVERLDTASALLLRVRFSDASHHALTRA